MLDPPTQTTPLSMPPTLGDTSPLGAADAAGGFPVGVVVAIVLDLNQGHSYQLEFGNQW